MFFTDTNVHSGSTSSGHRGSTSSGHKGTAPVVQGTAPNVRTVRFEDTAMMPVMPQDDSEGHLDELDIIDDLLNSLSDPSDQESHGGSQEPCDQKILDPGPSRPRSPWTVEASESDEDSEPYTQDRLV